MTRTVSTLLLGALIGTAGLFSAEAQQAKKSDKPEIKGGIEGTVKKVDVDNKTLTITANHKDRTFSITPDTIIVGPRGGLVRRRLKDPRFHEGLDITVVATGNTATELHLGYNRKEAEEKASEPRPAAKGSVAPTQENKVTATNTAKKGSKTAAKTTKKSAAGKKAEEPEEDEEYPGKVKRVDATKRLLVVTLLTGKDRSYLLSKDVKVLVKGTASKKGLQDPMLKPGIPVMIVTQAGGRKVKEVKVAPARAVKGKKAA